MPETAQLGRCPSGTQADVYLIPRLIIHSGNWKPVINKAVHKNEFIWGRVKNETMETAGGQRARRVISTQDGTSEGLER